MSNHPPSNMTTAYQQQQQPPQQQQPGQVPPPHLAGMPEQSRAYDDSVGGPPGPSDQQQQQQPQPQAPPPPTKGKNGATGPAEGKPKPHVCPICQRGFTTGGHLQRHQRIHTGIKAFKCPYPGCETRTSRQDNLQQHYRTHLSPTLRRGSGTQARQAVAAAMMAAGLKSSNSRQPRKSKGSNVGTPGSSSSASTVHGQSPYQTPTQSTAPYGGYMHDPNQPYGYPSYPLPPPGVNMGGQPQSSQSSRVPSPVNGHSNGAGSMPPSAHHQQYFSQPFSPAYAYPTSQYGQGGYRYGAPGAMQSPYGAPHSAYYSPGMAPDHGQQHMYSPLQAGGFAPHSRDYSSSVLNPNSYAGGQPPMGNGYAARAQNSTPGDELDPRYRGAGGAPPRAQSPRRRLTPPQQANVLSAGVVDPASMSTTPQHANGASHPTGGPMSAPYAYANGGYSYGQGMGQAHRTSMSSEDGPDNKPFPKHE